MCEITYERETIFLNLLPMKIRGARRVRPPRDWHLSCEALLIRTDRKTRSVVEKPDIFMPQHHAEVGTCLIR